MLARSSGGVGVACADAAERVQLLLLRFLLTSTSTSTRANDRLDFERRAEEALEVAQVLDERRLERSADGDLAYVFGAEDEHRRAQPFEAAVDAASARDLGQELFRSLQADVFGRRRHPSRC